jgi:uncharacterized protein (DUF488 family)
MASPLFTIGHSNHPIERFIALLTRHGVTALADVRSVPRSRFNPQFNRERLDAALREAGIAYVFLGDALGGKPDAPGGRDYNKMAAAPSFQAGLARVRDGTTRHRVALMCAEKEPLDCHRFVLVARHLRHDLAIQHILADGGLEPQDATEDRLHAATGLDRAEGGLLGESRAAVVERAYDARGAAMTRPRTKRPLRGLTRDDN